jgi:hypothetical protein
MCAREEGGREGGREGVCCIATCVVGGREEASPSLVLYENVDSSRRGEARALPPSLPPSLKWEGGREGGREEEVLVLSSVGCKTIIEKDKGLQAYLRGREGGREGGRVVWATEMLLDLLTKEEEGEGEGGREGGRYVLWGGGGGRGGGKEREKLKLAWSRCAIEEGEEEEGGEGEGEGGTQVDC